MSWNVNGWTENNQELRVKVINHLKPDIVCLSETHFTEQSKIQLDGYTYINHSRKAKHKDAPFTHGGVGILVRDILHKNYVVSIVDQSFDGVLAVSFKHRLSGCAFVVFSCYLPPESSPWCDATNFYAHLISLI